MIGRNLSIPPALVILLLAAIVPAAAQELLQNPGFEEVDADGKLVGWARYSGQGEQQELRIVDDAHSGARAARLIDNGPEERDSRHSIGLTQRVPVETGKYYTASVWVKALERNHSGALSMQLRFLPGNQITQVPIEPAIGEGWKRFQSGAQAPEGATHLMLYLYTMHYWTTDSILDDASITAVDVAAGTISAALLTHGSPGIAQVRELSLRTPIVAGGKPAARILVPEGDAYQAMGRRLSEAIRAKTGVELPVTTEYQGTVESPETIIALGNLNTNRMIERLYWNRYLRIDAISPGAGRYVLQTVHEPYNSPKGKNVLVIGASDDAGLTAGVDDFIGRIGDGPDFVLDAPLLHVSGQTLMTPEQRVALLAQKPSNDALRDFWAAVEKWRDTGDPAWAQRAKKLLFYCGDRFIQNPAYGVTWPEETTSQYLGAMWDVFEEAPVFTDQERLDATNIMLMTLYDLPRHCSGYGGLENNDTIIWNHTTFPLVGIYWLARYFNRYYGDFDGQMELMLRKVNASFEGQVTSWKPQEDSLGYYSIVPEHTIQYTLAENDYRYFENGSVRQHADYTIHIADNTGDPGGFGDSGYGHAPYTSNIHYALWYYKDGRYLWWLNKVLENGYRSPYDPSVQPVEWTDLPGVTVIPLHRQVYDYTKDRDYYNGPVSPPNVEFEKSFDKIAYRQNLDANGEYFTLDGYSRGKHLQYDGNAIIKFYADGQDWLVDGDYLVRNTTDHNMLSIIRDGRCETLIPTCTALEGVADLPSAGMTHTLVHDYNGADWHRYIFWLKGEFTLVADRVEALQAGDYSLLGNWKTLGDGEQSLSGTGVFKTARPAAGGAGSRGLVMVANPQEGIEKAVRFGNPYSRLDTAIELPSGKYAITTYATGTSTGSDSLFLSVDGGDRVSLHTPIGGFGPSSSTPEKDAPTPNVTITGDGTHVLSFTLREGPGIMMDRFTIHSADGRLVAEIEAEQAPPLPENSLNEAGSSDFYVKNDGFAANVLASRIDHVNRKITYLRQRFGGRLQAGESATLFNIFYADNSKTPKHYSIRKLSDTEALVLKDSEPFMVVGVGAGLDEANAPGAQMLATTREKYYAMGVTGAGDRLQAESPVGIEVDVASGRASVSASPQTAVRLAGTAVDMSAGVAEVDLSGWDHLAALREKTVAGFGEIINEALTPPATARTVVTAPAAMQPTWSQTIGLEAAEEDLPIFTVHPADLNGDGTDEVIVLRGAAAVCLDSTGKQLWRCQTGGQNRAVAVGDIDGNGAPEVLIGSDDEHIYVLNAAGEEQKRFHCDFPLRVGTSSVRDPKVGNIAVGDMDGDGVPEIVACMLNGNLVQFSRDFDVQWRYDRIPHGSRELELIDLDRDGKLEVLVANKYGAVQVFNCKGESRPGVYSELGDVEMGIGNMDEDADYEIANGSATGTSNVGQWGGATEFSFHNYGFAVRELIMADVAGDAPDELLVASETGYAYVLGAGGEVIAQLDFGEVVTDLGLLPLGDARQLVAASIADGRVYTLDGALQPVAAWKADGEVSMVQAVRTAEGVRLLAVTRDAVVCLEP